MQTAVDTPMPKSWANISIVWSDAGNWIGGSYALRDRESIEDFVAILGALRPHLVKPAPPFEENHPNA